MSALYVLKNGGFPNRFHIFLSLFLFLLFGCGQTAKTITSPPGHFANLQTGSELEKFARPRQNARNYYNENGAKSIKPQNRPRTGMGAQKNYPLSRSTEALLDKSLKIYEDALKFWKRNNAKNAVKYLDKAYALLLEVDVDGNPEYARRKEELRFMISKRNHEIYASRNSSVNGSHNAIPIVLNSHVQKEINRYVTYEKNFFIESYRRSGKHRPMILALLKEAGMPPEISWLPLIESGYKIRALSRARALGIWQFIPSTGYKFGLKRDVYIDERLDPVKSTKAAIAYLKALHKLFGDWVTALAAYNCGEGKVLRVIRDQKVNYLDNFWDLYKRLPSETAKYIPRFMATLHILNNLDKYGLSSLRADSPIDFETVTVEKRVSIENIAKRINVSEKILKELNPELRYNMLPPTQYNLKVPPGRGDSLLAVIDRIPVSFIPQAPFIRHKIKRGETLSDIAEKYRVSVKKIARANNIRKSNHISIGKTLKIPQRGGGRRSAPKNVQKSKYSGKTAGKSIHITRRGDSLWTIARRYGTTTTALRKENRLSTNKITIGQRLKIPGASKGSRVAKSLKTYITKNGDSPFIIAKRHNMSLIRFLKINNLTRSNKIFPGQKLYVDR